MRIKYLVSDEENMRRVQAVKEEDMRRVHGEYNMATKGVATSTSRLVDAKRLNRKLWELEEDTSTSLYVCRWIDL